MQIYFISIVLMVLEAHSPTVTVHITVPQVNVMVEYPIRGGRPSQSERPDVLKSKLEREILFQP